MKFRHGKASYEILFKTGMILLVLTFLSGVFFQTGLAGTSRLNIPIMVGVHPEGWIGDETVENEIVALDNWTGKKSSLAAVTFDVQDTAQRYLPAQLDSLWSKGYTPFIHLTFNISKPTAAEIARGEYDSALGTWATRFASWAVNGKFAFIAPLPEMNMPWFSYGMDPGNYKTAFTHIRRLFAEKNVKSSMARWVFEPTGWKQYPFEAYYPGDALVDVVSFTALNPGFCPALNENNWMTPEDLLFFPLRELNSLAPNKPIFVTHLASTDYTAPGVSDPAAKDAWLEDAYSYLTGFPNVAAVIYYNFSENYPADSNCNWRVFKANQIAMNGYKQGVLSSKYGYVTPLTLGKVNLNLAQSQSKKAYLPIITEARSTVNPVLIGTYTQNWVGSQQVIDDEYHALEAWSGKHMSLAGVFMGINTDKQVFQMIVEALWDNGYTPFINVSATDSIYTAKYIAQGGADAYLNGIASAYATLAKSQPDKMIYLAPLQEMNGSWVPYGLDPTNYKLSYQRFRQIFNNAGVPAKSVRWVFAPNGASDVGKPGFEVYYPGDSIVDIVGFTSYHFGYCSFVAPSLRHWWDPPAIFGPYLDKMRALAPHKPLFITQTATAGTNAGGFDYNAKNKWLYDAYTYLANQQNVRAILYYNRYSGAECDWGFYQKGGLQYDGFRTAMSFPVFDYIAPSVLKNLDLGVH